MKKKPSDRYQSTADMAEELRKYQDQLKAEESGLFNLRTLFHHLRQPKVAIPSLIILAAVAFFAIQYFSLQSKIRLATKEILPQMQQLLNEVIIRIPEEGHLQAYKLGLQAEKYIPDDPTFIELMSKCSASISVSTSPPGANIYVKDYINPEGEWKFVGISNIENLRLPYAYSTFKFEKKGYETVLAVHLPHYFDIKNDTYVPVNLDRVLTETESVPEDMAFIRKHNDIPEFYVDKYEVTNSRYKDFIEQGGYQKEEYWKQPIIKDGKQLKWEEAISEFVDDTGRPGPSTWIAGDYPEGEENYPVAGVSWYEAAAYAEFARKSLPTFSHWYFPLGASLPGFNWGFFPLMTAESNFSGIGTNPVGNSQGITPFGVFDMAGNVREWCWNEMPEGRGMMGGTWKDDGLLWRNYSQLPPFDRSSTNGFRCVYYIDEAQIPKRAYRKGLISVNRDYRKELPVSDELFNVYKQRFSYDKSDLKPEVEARDESHDQWILEKVSFNTAYGNERVAAYLFLPKKAKHPLQTVIYLPGSMATMRPSSTNMGDSRQFKDNLAFLVKNNRAVLYPIYKGTFERGDVSYYPRIHMAVKTHQAVEYWIQVVKDLKRSIDYLESRPEIDHDKLAYYGFSWGGLLGGIIPAVEDRIKVNILNMAGFVGNTVQPEIDPVNYLSRITKPTLLLSGRYDFNAFPLKTHAEPFFDMLGTSEDHKFHAIFDSDHFIPTNGLIREVSNFLDKYFGPAASMINKN
ncbi:SUMF1/EgtB/PvdO family nonheme iron enzyme [Acidobacteriota bacterium]